MKLRPYESYKHSGSRWIGDVPSHWQVRKLRSLISPRSERNQPDLPLLSVARERGVFVRSLNGDDNNHNVIPEDLTNYKVARKGDLVINKMKAWQGSMGIAPCDGLVSPAYFVFNLRIENLSFGELLVRSKPYVSHFGEASDGVRIGQWDLSVPRMREIPILVPQRDEQADIVNFLQQFNRYVVRIVQSKRQLTSLLNEQKYAIINRAVTHGLDANVKLKPSGVNWLGDVPQHWEVGPLRRFTIKRCDGPFGSGLKSSHYTDKGVRVIRLQNVGFGKFEDRDAVYISASHYKTLGDHDVLDGDVLIAGLGDDNTPAGRAVVAPNNIQPAMVKADCFRFRLRKGLSPYFVALQLSATAAIASSELARGATRQRVNLSSMSRRAIAIPPLPEQDAIISHITQNTVPIEQALTRILTEVDLLRDYRARLVADVVTGKLNVRGIELPAIDELQGSETGSTPPADAVDDFNETTELDETEDFAYADD